MERNERHCSQNITQLKKKISFIFFFAQIWNGNPPQVILHLLLVCSGAEQATETYSRIRERTQRHLDSYARDGLRTLCIAKKVVLETVWLYLFTPKKSQTL